MPRGPDFAPLSSADQEAAGFDPAQAAGLFVGVRRFVGQGGEASTEFQEIPFAVNDAIDLADMFVRRLKLIPAGNAHLLLSGEPITQEREETLSRLKAAGVVLGRPTFSDLIDALVKTASMAGKHGLLLVSMASHGISLDGQDRILCLNSRPGSLLKTTSVAWSLLSEELQKSDCKRILTLLDACRENVSGARGMGGSLPNTLSEAITRVQGMAVLCGAPPGGFCFDDAASKNGAFTAHLLRGLREGAEADEHGHVTLESLAAWVDQNLKQWLKKQGKAQDGITLRLEPHEIRALPLAFRPSQVEESREALKEKWALEVKAREAAERVLQQRIMEQKGAEQKLRSAQVSLTTMEGALRDREQALSSLQEAMSARNAELTLVKTEVRRLEEALEDSKLALEVAEKSLREAWDALRKKEEELTATNQALEHKKSDLAETQKSLEKKDEALVVAHQEKKSLLEDSAKSYSAKVLELELTRKTLLDKEAALVVAHAGWRDNHAAVEKLQKEKWELVPLLVFLLVALVLVGIHAWRLESAAPIKGETQTIVETQTALPGSMWPITWVSVPAGEFTMGSNDGRSDEKPPHPVKLSAFKLSKTEVTVAQYDACVQAGKCTEPTKGDKDNSCNWKVAGREKHPINCVDWDQAKAFTVWLSGVTGQDVRLPSEAQWEYAARGPEGRKYPWGSTDPTQELANYGINVRSTTPVGEYPKGASWVGALDMAGNVWEWTEDCWHEGYTKAPVDGSVWTTGCTVPSFWADREKDPLNIRVLRGGSWGFISGWLRGAYRDGGWAGKWIGYRGFRPVLLAPPGGEN